MALDLTQKTDPPKPFTGARIFFGVRPPNAEKLAAELHITERSGVSETEKCMGR